MKKQFLFGTLFGVILAVMLLGITTVFAQQIPTDQYDMSDAYQLVCSWVKVDNKLLTLPQLPTETVVVKHHKTPSSTFTATVNPTKTPNPTIVPTETEVPPTITPNPTKTPKPTNTPVPTVTKKEHCDKGEGNGGEDCDPGNNPDNGNNDED